MIMYSEVDIKVSASGDLSLGANKDFEMADASGTLKQDITFRLRTDYGDFLPHPDVGASLSDIIGEPNTRETATKGELKIIHSLTKDGRVASSDLIVKAVPISLSSLAYYLFVRDGRAVLNVSPDLSLDLNKGIITY